MMINVLDGVGWYQALYGKACTSYTVRHVVGCSQSTAYRWLRHLHENGFVARKKITTKRSTPTYTYELTSDGYELLRKAGRVIC